MINYALKTAKLVRHNKWLNINQLCSPVTTRPVEAVRNLRGDGHKTRIRVEAADRIPEFIKRAYRIATSGRKGPVYLEIPSDLFFDQIDPEKIKWPSSLTSNPQPLANSDELEKLAELLAEAERPVMAVGSGIHWASAYDELRQFVDATGIPVVTTPQARGVLDEESQFCMVESKTKALKEADLIISLGTRSNWMWNHFQPPTFSNSSKMVCINIDATEIDSGKVAELGIVADARMFLIQAKEHLQENGAICHKYSSWLADLNGKMLQVQNKVAAAYSENESNETIHPLRLTKEIEKILTPETIFIGDGHECFEFARLNLKFRQPHGFMSSGPNVCMGVGVPMAMGCKVANPERPVVVLMGDGGFGWNGMEYETAIRNNLPFVGIVSNNGGFTATSRASGVGRELGFLRYDKMVEALGGYGEFVDKPEDIAPALKRAAESGLPSCVNVKVDPDVVGVKMHTVQGVKEQIANSKKQGM